MQNEIFLNKASYEMYGIGLPEQLKTKAKAMRYISSVIRETCHMLLRQTIRNFSLVASNDVIGEAGYAVEKAVFGCVPEWAGVIEACQLSGEMIGNLIMALTSVDSEIPPLSVSIERPRKVLMGFEMDETYEFE